jgi:CDP-diacylglycerol--serine O-phosphatidyltransferase
MKSWRFLIPNFFTASGAALGLASIFLASEASLYWAAWCILWSVLLDKADGTAARWLNATSAFGTQFDSMADLIAFGLAPALLIYSAGRNAWNIIYGHPYWWVLLVGCGLYAVCAAIRLARFNIAEMASGQRYFTGLPTTLCGAVVGSALLVAIKYELPVHLLRNLPIFLGLMGMGMVSKLPVPKLLARRNKAFNTLQVANVVAIYLCGFTMKFPEYVLGLAIFYLLVGTLYGMFKHPHAVQRAGERSGQI